MGSFWEKFGEWQNYAHYFLLTVGLFIWHALPTTSALEQNFVNTLLGFDKWVAGGEMFLWYMLGLFLIDSLVHMLFYFLPKPLQWRD